MEISKRDYQPSLLWAKAYDWYIKNHSDENRTYGPHDLTLYIYRKDTDGAYMMTSPKMYWADEPIGQYFNNVDQGDLFKNKDTLKEVLFWDRRKRQTFLVGKSFEEAVANIS